MVSYPEAKMVDLELSVARMGFGVDGRRRREISMHGSRETKTGWPTLTTAAVEKIQKSNSTRMF